MILAHRIALDPNNAQAAYLARAAGTARFAYNWALAEWKRQYEAHKTDTNKPKPNQMALRRQLNTIKREQFPWMLEVTKCAPQLAIIQLGEAFKRFFSGQNRYPTFRKKGRDDRFSLSNDQFSVEASRIRIPNLGWVRMRESLRFSGKILSATVSRKADRWFVSITVDVPDVSHLSKAENQGTVGVDLGVSAMATLSTGEKIVGPKPLTTLLDRLRRQSRELSRKQKGSSNRRKARARLAKLQARIANIRSDAMHKLTSSLTRRFDTIGLEDLNVSGMLANKRLARSIADMSFHEFRRQVEYKAEMRGGRVAVAERWFPSSKICSTCGTRADAMPLNVRKWTCTGCGTTHDRDVNAAVNLKIMAASSAVSACGEEGSGLRRKTKVKPASAKQEPDSKPAA